MPQKCSILLKYSSLVIPLGTATVFFLFFFLLPPNPGSELCLVILLKSMTDSVGVSVGKKGTRFWGTVASPTLLTWPPPPTFLPSPTYPVWGRSSIPRGFLKTVWERRRSSSCPPSLEICKLDSVEAKYGFGTLGELKLDLVPSFVLFFSWKDVFYNG